MERAAGRTGGVREFIATCYGQPGVDPVRAEAAALVTDARAAGLRVGALSNEAALLFPPDILATLYVLADLDAFVDLSFADVLKPQPEAYRIAVDALDLAAARVLFVDDQPANVAGARAAGRDALHFDVTHPRASIQRIRDRLSLAARHPN